MKHIAPINAGILSLMLAASFQSAAAQESHHGIARSPQAITKINQKNYQQVSASVDLLVQNTPSSRVEVTGVQLNQTDEGLQIILEAGEQLVPLMIPEGNNVIIDIFDATLAIPEGEFQATNPTEDIAEVTVTQPDPNAIRIVITGNQALIAEVVPSQQNLVLSVTSQGTTVQTQPESEIDVVVTATRTAETEADVPRSVTVVDREQIEEQTTLFRDLGEILGQEVPGLAPGNQSLSEFGQTLRGRNQLVLIDGVPQSSSRNAFRNLRTIDPGVIERIEIVRGPTALYGDGATGGIINIITQTGEGEPSFPAEIGFGSSLSDFDSDSFGGVAQIGVSAAEDNVDYRFNVAYDRIGALYDGEGDRIPPDLQSSQGSLAETNNINLFGKIGYEIDDHRLELTANYYNSDQDTDYLTDPSVNEFEPGTQKALARDGLELEDQPEIRNTFVNLDYDHPNLFLRGLDYSDEEASQPLAIFDQAAFAASDGRVFNQIDDRPWVPPLSQRNLGLFAQLEWQPVESMVLRGGLRYEDIGIEVDDFSTIIGNDIEGGDLDYDATLFNIGVVYKLTEELSTFANFAQGFSVADVGLVLRGAPTGFSVTELNPEAQKVDSYEIGIKGQWERVQFSLAGFYNESDLGTTFAQETFAVIRSPEEVYGVEAVLDYQINSQWQIGSSFSYVEGDNDPDDDGEFTPLTGFRIPPIKLTAYVENETLPGWRNRLQMLYSGARDRAFEEEVDFQEVESYIVFDLISSLEIGEGTLSLGIQNLFNNQYFTATSQLLRLRTNESYTAASGITFSLQYAVEF